ncbi:MAG: hypothetical protein N2C12_16245 [Planctomycetales bacterium]
MHWAKSRSFWLSGLAMLILLVCWTYCQFWSQGQFPHFNVQNASADGSYPAFGWPFLSRYRPVEVVQGMEMRMRVGATIPLATACFTLFAIVAITVSVSALFVNLPGKQSRFQLRTVLLIVTLVALLLGLYRRTPQIDDAGTWTISPLVTDFDQSSQFLPRQVNLVFAPFASGSPWCIRAPLLIGFSCTLFIILSVLMSSCQKMWNLLAGRRPTAKK